MAIPLIINGQTFQYPETGDPSWGLAATSWAAAVTSGMLQKAGGTFTLLADVDFGANFGVKSLYYKTRTASPASAGQFRLAKTDVISWHNNAGGGNLDLGIDGSDDLTFNGAVVGKIVSVLDTNSINLTLSSGVLSADLLLSAAAATGGFFKATASIETDGLLVQAQIAATAQTGFLSSTDWNTFNGKQAAGSYITALTGDVTASGPGSVAATIANNAVTNAKAAQMAAHTFKGNNTGSTANSLDLSATQLTAELNVMTGDSGSGGLKGLVPAQVTGDATKFLSGAGTWTSPAGSGDVVGPASAVGDNIVSFNSTTGKLIKDSGKAAASVVVGPSSATDSCVALFDGTTGKLLKDSALPYTPLYIQETAATGNMRGSEGSGTTTLTISDNPHQIFNLSAGRTVKLPTTSVAAGAVYTMSNPNGYTLTIQASDASAITTISKGTLRLVALSATPVANTAWAVINPGPVLGRTDGVAIPSGHLGQKITGTLSDVGASGTTNMGTIDLTPGVWMLYGGMALTFATLSAFNYLKVAISDANNTLPDGQYFELATSGTAGLTDILIQPAPQLYVNISSNTTYYLNYSVSASGTGLFSIGAKSYLFAVRVG